MSKPRSTRHGIKNPIPLPSQERLRRLFEWDEERGALLWRESGTGRRHGAGAPAGTLHNNRTRVGIRKVYYQLHRLIWMYAHGEDLGTDVIDHKDGDPTNNRISNLRRTVNTRNLHNAKTRTDNSSGVKGVTWKKDQGKWYARVSYFGKRHALGYFHELADAKKAVEAFRENLHGEFANHG